MLVGRERGRGREREEGKGRGHDQWGSNSYINFIGPISSINITYFRSVCFCHVVVNLEEPQDWKYDMGQLHPVSKGLLFKITV